MTSKDKRPQRSNVNEMNLYLLNTVFSRSAKVASLNKKKMQPNDLIDLDAHQEAYVQKSSTSFVARGNGPFCSFAIKFACLLRSMRDKFILKAQLREAFGFASP